MERNGTLLYFQGSPAPIQLGNRCSPSNKCPQGQAISACFPNIPSPDERLLVPFRPPWQREKGTVPSSISFRSKPYDFVPCLNLRKIILPVPDVILPSLSGKLFESRECDDCENFRRVLSRGICAGFVVVDLYELRIVLSISNRNPEERRFRVSFLFLFVFRISLSCFRALLHFMTDYSVHSGVHCSAAGRRRPRSEVSRSLRSRLGGLVNLYRPLLHGECPA
jgi:hypothetical protein